MKFKKKTHTWVSENIIPADCDIVDEARKFPENKNSNLWKNYLKYLKVNRVLK